MKRRSFLATCAYSLLIGANGALQTASAKDRVVGTIWSFTLSRKGRDDQKGQFRMYNLEIFKGPKKVGTGIRDGATTGKLIITDYPPFNGIAVMRKVRHNPARWSGTLTKTNGKEWHMVAEVKEK
jgi:hypothetical protein